MKISKREAEKYVAAFNKHYGRLDLAGAEFGISRDAMRRRLSYAEQQHGLKPKNFSVLEKADAQQEGKSAADNAYLRSTLKQARADIDALQKEIQRYEYAMSAGITPAAWTLPDAKASSGLHMPVLLVSDAQVGEVIDKEETEYGRGYNTPIFRERYRELITTTIALSEKHVSPDWIFPGIIYIRGGDAISGGIHDELRETDDMSPLEAARVVFEEEAAGILKLREFFGKVDVKSVGGGNHDRITRKPQSKRRAASNYDTMIDYMLAHEFKDDPNVTFQLTKSTDVVFPIFDRLALATHGDNIGSSGGTGFIGPVANIAKGVQKVIMEQAHMNRIIEHVFMGHFHTFHHCRAFTANGSFPGFSEFAKRFRMRPEPPTQSFQFWHRKRGLVDMKPIVLF